MNCVKCGSKWKLNAARMSIASCPFCGEKILDQNPQLLVSNVMVEIVGYFGTEIYLNQQRFGAILSDYLPKLSQERNTLRLAIDRGIAEKLYDIKDLSSEAVDEKLIEYKNELLSSGMADKWARIVVSTLAKPLNISVEHIDELKEEDKEQRTLSSIGNNIGWNHEDADKLEEYDRYTIEQLTSLSNKGDAFALNELAMRYYSGIGIKKNIAIAVDLFSKSAALGFSVAQCNLGSLYEDGIGVLKDEAKAFVLYHKSAEQDYVLGIFRLAEC